MNTMEEIKTGLNLIEVEGESLLTLLEGVSSHAGRDKYFTRLNAVEVEGEGGDLVARATDRYRLIEGAIRVMDGQLDKALISLDDTKRIITLVKAHKSNLISLSRIANALTVSSLGDSLTITLLDDTFPPTADLFAKSEGEPVAIKGVAFNPALMADYAKIAGKGAAIKIYFTGEGKPMRVRITGDKVTWKALLMPMTYKD